MMAILRSELTEIADEGNRWNARFFLIGELTHLNMIASLAEQNLTNGFHDLSDLDALRATHIACIAGSADPNGSRLKELIF